MSAIQHPDNHFKRGQRGREMRQLKAEVDASLWAKKIEAKIADDPFGKLARLRKITNRMVKPHLYSLTRSFKERLVQAIAREGPDILDDYLDPKKYYTLYIGDVPVLFVDAQYAVKGDEISCKEVEETVDGMQFNIRPIALESDINDDESVYWMSCENEDLRIDKETASLVLELLVSDTKHKLFTVVGKAEPFAVVAEEESTSEHRITVVRGSTVKPGALDGIDREICRNGRAYLVFFRYELRPLPEQKAEPGPMMVGDGEFRR